MPTTLAKDRGRLIRRRVNFDLEIETKIELAKGNWRVPRRNKINFPVCWKEGTGMSVIDAREEESRKTRRTARTWNDEGQDGAYHLKV